MDNYPKTPKKLKLTRRGLVMGAIALLVLLASNYATYAWQHKQALSIAAKQAKATGAVLANNAETYNDLQKKYQEAQAELSAQSKAEANSALDSEAESQLVIPTQADLDLTVNGAITTVYSGYNLHTIGINLTLKNNTTSSIYFSPTAYQLKDDANHLFTYYQPGGGYGKDYVPLTNQTFAPGATVTGSIALTIADSSVTSYTLILGDHSYKVTATKSDKEWPLN